MEQEQPIPFFSGRTGLVMTGGGARAAYQVGVLMAIAEMLPRKTRIPFPILCGTSAGAVNAAVLAANALDFRKGVHRLVSVWKNFHTHHVYRSDLPGVLSIGMRWMAAMFSGGLGRYNPVSLLDNMPLAILLKRHLPFDAIQDAIDAGALYALCVTAIGYSSGQSVSFFQGAQELKPWNRARRVGVPTRIELSHVMASSAIPVIFPAVKINREYFGDGSMRQLAPISPALHVGADRVLVLGVRYRGGDSPSRSMTAGYPTLAQIGGHVLNSIFLDSLDVDLERLQRINRTIRLIPDHKLAESGISLRKVDVLVISPSQDIEKIAAKHAKSLPGAIRFLFRGIGATSRTGSNLLSYLLFEKPYCRELLALGYNDAMKIRKEILGFLRGEDTSASIREKGEESGVANV